MRWQMNKTKASTDWLVETPKGRILKIQVKLVRHRKQHRAPTVSLCGAWGKRRYKKGDFDFIVGYDLYSDTAYVWSWDEVSDHQWEINVSPEIAEKWDKLKE